MKREDVLKLFPDATDEQITNLLNQSNKEILNEKNKAAQYKEKADKADELQAKIDELESNGLSETEKANKALETANARIAELEKAQSLAAQRSTAAAKFNVTAEQASQIIKDDGTFDYDILGQIITDKETAAAKAKESEIAAGSANPGGSSGKKSEDEKTEDVKNAESITFGASAPDEAAKNHYVL